MVLTASSCQSVTLEWDSVGGARTYERTKPFFLGLVMGQLVVGGVWLVIDSMTGTVGNVIPVFY